jgi:hypothetical protein
VFGIDEDYNVIIICFFFAQQIYVSFAQQIYVSFAQQINISLIIQVDNMHEFIHHGIERFTSLLWEETSEH